MALKKLFLFVLILFIGTVWSYGQVEKDTSIVYTKTTEYIEKYPNRLTAKLFYINTYNSLTVKDRNSDLQFELEPNKQNRIGASLSYSFITLSYSFAPNFMAENEDNEDSKLFNLNFRTYLGKWMQTFDLYNEKGFYIKSDFGNLYFPDVKNFKIGGSTSYIFNDNFSFRAIASQDEKQLKSAGSFVPGLTYYYSKLNLKGQGDAVAIDEDYYSYDIALTPAYYYNFVPSNNLLLSVGASAGLGVNHSKGEDEKLTSLLTEMAVAGLVSYDINSFYTGANYRYLILNHNTDRTASTQDNIPFFQAFIGYRFKAPKSWVRTERRLKEKIKL